MDAGYGGSHFRPMKKLLVLLLLVVASFFALKKWSPGTLRKITGVLSNPGQSSPIREPLPALPLPEPAPAPKPTDAEPPPVAAPAPKLASVDKTAQVIVLGYHRMEGQTGGALSIAPELFEQHMQRLRDNGIQVISMQDFLAWRRNEKSIPAKSALITIDDGYVSAFDVARPILKKFNYPWTYFIYTKYVGSGGKSITWEQLGVLRDEGVEIGCHTASHINLRETRGKSPEAYDAWLREEIIGSKQLIEQKLAIRCAVFAYPEGRYSTKVLELVQAASYEAAFTVYGQRITHGAPADKIGRYAWYTRRPQDMELALNFTGPLSASDEEQPASGEIAAAMLLTQPVNGETISDPEPVLKANLTTLGAFEENSLVLRLSGIGPIPAKFDRDNKIIEARPPQPLKPGEYTVVVSGKNGRKRIETQWTFKIDPHGGLNAPLEAFSANPLQK